MRMLLSLCSAVRDLEAALTQLSEALPPTQGEDEHKAEAQENKSET